MRNTGLATATAALVVLAQVSSKSVRDGLFLGVFGDTWLPTAVIAGAALSLIVVLLTTRLLSSYRVGGVAVGLFASSAALFAIEWWLLSVSPELAAALLFGHVTGLGAVLVSTFWNLANSASDPRAARKSLGTIGMGAAFGGLVGGVLAERIVALFDLGTLLLFLCVTQIGCAALAAALARAAASADPKPAVRLRAAEAVGLLRERKPIRQLVLLVVMLAAAGGLLDFLLKQAAVAEIESQEDLTRFFGVLYTAVSAGTFLLQALLGRRALERFGLAKTALALPAFLVAGGVGCLVSVGLVVPVLARGGGVMLANSFFRSAYELLFAPIGQKEREASKLVVDVGSQRIGAALAGFAIQAILLTVGAVASRPVIAAAATALAVGAVGLVRRMAAGYVHEIQQRLLRDGADVELPRLEEELGRSLATIGAGGIDVRKALLTLAGGAVIGEEIDRAPSPVGSSSDSETSVRRASDPVVDRLEQLRSADERTVSRALRAPVPLELAGFVVPLLARDELRTPVERALERLGPRCVGLLTDTLVDPDEVFAVRRRVARVLARIGGDRAAHGLLLGLDDARFEVQLRCAEALLSIRDWDADPDVRDGIVYAAIRRELQADRRTREARALLDADAAAPGFEGTSGETLAASLRYLMTLLALVLPFEAVKVAHKALVTDDARLRGVAIEYLTNAVPESLRELLAAALESGPRPSAAPLGGGTTTGASIPEIAARLHGALALGDVAQAEVVAASLGDRPALQEELMGYVRDFDLDAIHAFADRLLETR